MKNCQNIYILSAIACQLAECMDENDLAILAAYLTALGDMLTAILARNSD